jgi:hypothetical protein
MPYCQTTKPVWLHERENAMLISKIQSIIVTVLTLLSLIGCKDDTVPYKIWVDPRFGVALDTANEAIDSWNELVAPRKSQAFNSQGLRTDTYDKGSDEYDDNLELYCITNAEIPQGNVVANAVMLPTSALLKAGAAPHAEADALPVLSTQRSLMGGHPVDTSIIGLAGPKDDALVFCERIAGGQDPAKMSPGDLDWYLKVIRKVALHELGHVLGLVHTDYSNPESSAYGPGVPDVMDGTGNMVQTLSDWDLKMYCYPNECG